MKGVLLVNLGSPDSTNPKDVKKYLDEFLMDPRVIDVPYWARVLLVRGIILNTRPKKSAAAYKKIWWDEGSPLIVISERLQNKIQQKTTLPVALAMRYGSMTIKKGMEELIEKGVKEILVIPLYPQFAMATTETISVKIEEIKKEHFPEADHGVINRRQPLWTIAAANAQRTGFQPAHAGILAQFDPTRPSGVPPGITSPRRSRHRQNPRSGRRRLASRSDPDR